MPAGISCCMPRQDPELTAFAREMRQDPTRAEATLWRELRGNALGVRFRRQAPMGRYVADFACVAAKVIVEIDGPTHEGRERYDAARDDWFRRRGWHVIRITDEEVAENCDGVIAGMIIALEQRGLDTGVAERLTW